MGQIEIYEILKAKPNKWFKSIELNKQLKRTVSALATPLKELFNSGFIIRKRTGERNEYKYKWRK